MSLMSRGIISSGKLDAGGGGSSFHNTLLLNGTNQHVNCGNAASTISTDFSVTIHFYPLVTEVATIISKSTAQSNLRDWEIITQASGKIGFFLASNGAGSTQSTLNTSNNYNLNQWNTLTARLDTTGTTRYIVLNGTETNDSWTFGHSGALADLLLGVRKNSVGTLIEYFDGSLSIPIITDSLPSGSELTELMTAKQPVNYSSGLKAKYNVALPLNDGDASPYIDISGNNNDGTPVNSPTFTTPTLEFFA